ncbi:MAG: Rieske (2Fe-2S) protein [bacterium]|nr:Rieske (2Fe-2S) protein [bacterium]
MTDDTMQLLSPIAEIPVWGMRFTYKEGPFETEGILVRLNDTDVRAYKNECRHLPIPLDQREPAELWDASGKHLCCSSHGARYRPKDGLCVDGPCKGSHLKQLPLQVVDGEVFLDTSQIGGFFNV